jgi:hypothetical protein
MTENQTQPATNVTQDAKPQIVIDATPTDEKQKGSEEQWAESLKDMQENAGQIAELAAEEANVVTRFFSSLLKIMKPFGKTLEISASALPENYNGRISKAYLYLTGQLVLVYTNGEVEILNLADQENHDVLVKITDEIMVKLKSVINEYKAKTEKRVRFLMSITKELQKVAEVFSEK